MPPDTLILGAGASGLACARKLSHTHDLLILEARDRIGGRILTHRSAQDPLPIELGPEFIHGRAQETFDLLDEARLIAYDQTFKHFDVIKGKPREHDRAWTKVENLLEKMTCPSADCAFRDWIDKQNGVSPAVRKRAINYVESFNAARHERISVKSLLNSNEEEEKLGEVQFKIVGGHDQLAAAMANGLLDRVRLNTVVKTIRWSRGKVQVIADTLGGEMTFSARRCVITLPLGVLQSGSVTFEPELPVAGLIRDKLCMGHVRKVTLRCRSPFWEKVDPSLSFIHAMDAPIPVWWTTHPLRTKLLTGWVGGSRAEQLDPNRLRESVMDSLRRVFGRPARELAGQIIAMHTHHWSEDPFTRGAYSYAAVGGAGAPARLAKPIAGTLYFAGEHTHTGLMGTVAGAIQTGYHAAELILGG